MDNLAYLGQSIKYPITVTAGAIEKASGVELINGKLLMLYTTKYGSRYMQFDYGTRMHELIFEPNDDVLKRLLTDYTEKPVAKWVPEIQVINTVVVTGTDAALIYTSYIILATSQPGTFVFPFIKDKWPY